MELLNITEGKFPGFSLLFDIGRALVILGLSLSPLWVD